MIAGKLLLSAFGLTLTLHPVGGVIGCAVGHLCDLWWQNTYVPARSQSDTWNDFSLYSIYLAACMAKADGVVSKEEIRAFKRSTNYRDQDDRLVGQLFNQGWRIQHSEMELIRRLGQLGMQNPKRLEQVMHMLEKVARAGQYGPNQQALLQQAARAWGLSGERFAAGGADSTYKSFREEPDASTYNKALKKLGLKAGAAEDEIKSAYKKLVRLHHPDKVRAKGGSDTEVRKAEQRLAEINEAYELVSK